MPQLSIMEYEEQQIWSALVIFNVGVRNKAKFCIWFLSISILGVPGSLYAICRAHQHIDGLNEWRARSHACCVLLIEGKLKLFLYLLQNRVHYVNLNSVLISFGPFFVPFLSFGRDAKHMFQRSPSLCV